LSHIPFAPWMRGNRALDMVRNADGPKRSVAPLTYYSAVLAVHEKLSGEIWSAEAWVSVARTKLMEGDLQAAESALSQAGMMGTPDAEAPMLLAEVLLATDRAGRARDLMTNVVAQRPAVARAHYLLGLACRDLGLGDKEAAAYRSALAIDPDIGIAWYRLGNHLSLKKNWTEAVAAYREALRVSPDNESVLFGAALALNRTGDAEAAQECLAHLRELESELVELLEFSLEPRKPIPPGVRLRSYGARKKEEGKGDS
jgi:tetratricopeptide (TPR) repeat protein